MSKPRASTIRVCVFVKTPSSRAFDQGQVAIENLTGEEQLAWNVANEAATKLYVKYKLDAEINICPWDLDNNNSVTAKLGLFNFPAMVIVATYPDETRKMIPLGKEINEKFFGINWKASDIYPYYEALYLQNFKTGDGTTSVLCKIFPPLCEIGAYAWFALAAVSTYKAVTSKDHPAQQVAWGATGLLAFEELYSKGGLEAIFPKKI